MKKLLWLLVWGAFFALLSGFTLIGHRGDPLSYPEETFQSFDSAFAKGANYVELDIHESADGVLVIQHDSTIARMTGVDLPISTSNFSVLQQYHTRNGEPVHSLEELFARSQQTNQKFLIETKRVKGEAHPQMEAKLAALVTRYHMTDRVMFHSFSLSSLQSLKKLLPQVPRILIVGSLKRINFAIFDDVDGINLSSDLVTPQLVSQLHYIGKKVYVWDEMNEDRTLWNWLSNLNVDGVVTNYVSLGHEFQSLKNTAVTTTVDQLGANSSDAALPIYMNPYQPNLRKQTLAANAVITIKKAVQIGGNDYYQIGDNAFVPAATINIAPRAGWALLFLNQDAIITGSSLSLPTIVDPLHPTQTAGHITTGETVKITAVRFTGSNLYLQTDAGWVASQNIQMLPKQTNMVLWLSQYRAIPNRLKPVVHLALENSPLLDASRLG